MKKGTPFQLFRRYKTTDKRKSFSPPDFQTTNKKGPAYEKTLPPQNMSKKKLVSRRSTLEDLHTLGFKGTRFASLTESERSNVLPSGKHTPDSTKGAEIKYASGWEDQISQTSLVSKVQLSPHSAEPPLTDKPDKEETNSHVNPWEFAKVFSPDEISHISSPVQIPSNRQGDSESSSAVSEIASQRSNVPYSISSNQGGRSLRHGIEPSGQSHGQANTFDQYSSSSSSSAFTTPTKQEYFPFNRKIRSPKGDFLPVTKTLYSSKNSTKSKPDNLSFRVFNQSKQRPNDVNDFEQTESKYKSVTASPLLDTIYSGETIPFSRYPTSPADAVPHHWSAGSGAPAPAQAGVAPRAGITSPNTRSEYKNTVKEPSSRGKPRPKQSRVRSPKSPGQEQTPVLHNSTRFLDSIIAPPQSQSLPIVWIAWFLGLDEFESLVHLMARFLLRLLSIWFVSTFASCLKQQLLKQLFSQE